MAAWNMDEVPYPGPHEQPTGWEFAKNILSQFGWSSSETTNHFNILGENIIKLGTAFDDVKIKTTIPPRKGQTGPRPKNTFDRRGRRNY